MTVERCPVCNGNGLVDNGFYLSAGNTGTWTTSSAEPDTCKSCAGKGYVVVEDERLEITGTKYPVEICIGCMQPIDKCTGSYPLCIKNGGFGND